MGHRLPTILGKAIDDVIRTLNERSSEEEVVDLVECIERMEGLMTDLSGNANLRYIVDGRFRSPYRRRLLLSPAFFVVDGEADVALWNKEIAKYFQGMDV
jgi:RNA-binding protein YlmH